MDQPATGCGVCHQSVDSVDQICCNRSCSAYHEPIQGNCHDVNFDKRQPSLNHEPHSGTTLNTNTKISMRSVEIQESKNLGDKSTIISARRQDSCPSKLSNGTQSEERSTRPSHLPETYQYFPFPIPTLPARRGDSRASVLQSLRPREDIVSSKGTDFRQSQESALPKIPETHLNPLRPDALRYSSFTIPRYMPTAGLQGPSDLHIAFEQGQELEHDTMSTRDHDETTYPAPQIVHNLRTFLKEDLTSLEICEDKLALIARHIEIVALSLERSQQNYARRFNPVLKAIKEEMAIVRAAFDSIVKSSYYGSSDDEAVRKVSQHITDKETQIVKLFTVQRRTIIQEQGLDRFWKAGYNAMVSDLKKEERELSDLDDVREVIAEPSEAIVIEPSQTLEVHKARDDLIAKHASSEPSNATAVAKTQMLEAQNRELTTLNASFELKINDLQNKVNLLEQNFQTKLQSLEITFGSKVQSLEKENKRLIDMCSAYQAEVAGSMTVAETLQAQSQKTIEEQQCMQQESSRRDEYQTKLIARLQGWKKQGFLAERKADSFSTLTTLFESVLENSQSRAPVSLEDLRVQNKELEHEVKKADELEALMTSLDTPRQLQNSHHDNAVAASANNDAAVSTEEAESRKNLLKQVMFHDNEQIERLNTKRKAEQLSLSSPQAQEHTAMTTAISNTEFHVNTRPEVAIQNPVVSDNNETTLGAASTEKSAGLSRIQTSVNRKRASNLDHSNYDTKRLRATSKRTRFNVFQA